MNGRPKFLDDLAGVASGAASALTGIGEELEQRIAARLDEAFRAMKLVRREEFDAALELAANARAGQEELEARFALLEARIAALEGAAGPGARAADAGEADGHLHDEGGLGGPPEDGSAAAEGPGHPEG